MKPEDSPADRLRIRLNTHLVQFRNLTATRRSEKTYTSPSQANTNQRLNQKKKKNLRQEKEKYQVHLYGKTRSCNTLYKYVCGIT